MPETLHDKFTRDVMINVSWNCEPSSNIEAGRCDTCRTELGMVPEGYYKNKPVGSWTDYCTVTVSVYGVPPLTATPLTFCREDAGWRNISSFIEDLISE